MSKPLVLTHHARARVAERKIPVAWVEQTVRHPGWTEPEPFAPSIERRFRAIPEFGGRILRVACVETDSHIRIITVTFDRDARRKP
ncbi:DUF4258 domain-containing protein [Rhodopseudomonas boonkerdii]|uniref:DUF4258 domain-containing protein n=1 Tax=Rhodopseudomonas boonkerdii TaxID=475937 RepID=UPI001E29F73B|nr:DUF4258 domain-containing protein [Rhodopseudomonas boonkerdii]UGV28322.1 DUF4258 domain-containing protein [Rhodopseudomonas boonkerdii]